MKSFKKFLCLALATLMIISMTGWTTGDIWSPEKYVAPEASSYPAGGTVIASNSKYQMKWDATNCAVELVEIGTENSWGVVAETNEETAADNPLGLVMTSDEVASAAIIEVLDQSNNQRSYARSKTSAVENGFVVTEDIVEGGKTVGIKVKYYFNDVDIMIPMEFRLRDDSVAVSVNPNEILEGDQYKPVSVRVAPFWCSTPNDAEDSYLFLPSGSGALVSTETVSSGGTDYLTPMYGIDLAMIEENSFTTTKEARVPVFGAKYGNIGTCAIIENGAESCYVGAKVGSSSLKSSGAYVCYQLRDYTDNYRQSLNSKVRDQVYAQSMNQTTMTVAFYPLTGDKANYSGMAETYKNYLKGQGTITETVDDSALNVTFIGGMLTDESFLGVPYKEMLAATTVSEAQTILTELSGATGAKISARLEGFGSAGVESGSYGNGFKLNKNLGSLKDLSALNEYAKANNIDLYFDFDLVALPESSSGFSTFFDAAYSPVLKSATVYKYNVASRSYDANSAYNLLTRSLLADGADKMLKKISKWDLSGVSLASLSNSAYSDYSTQTTDYYGKSKMGEDVTAIMNKVSENNYKIASADANAYAALASDIIYDTPTTSSRERIFITDVPFYQMVFKGYVAMAGESINTAANATEEVLNAVEAGIGLSYTVINRYDNEYIDYQGYEFFGSQYSDIKDGIISTYNGLKDYYAAINGAEISTHTILDSGLRQTVFSNGVTVYVNYTDTDITAPNGDTVEANNYIYGKE